MEKLLTITVPAYNAEQYLARCLDSLLGKNGQEDVALRADERLEILVINDGSSDDTGKIADRYAVLYPSVIRVIHKENGGHGSGINAGISSAKGRYFKVLDADDWVISDSVLCLLDFLKQTDADVIVTGYQTFNERTGKTQCYSLFQLPGREPHTVSIEEFAEIFEQMPACFQFHGLCYRTDFFRSLDIRMSEKVYYEDQEYAVLPFLKAETIALLPVDLYVYRVGDEMQSVSYKNLDKRLEDMKHVLRKLSAAHKQAALCSDWTDAREAFFTKRLSIAAVSFFAVTLVKSGSKERGLKEAEQFMRFLEENEPEVAANTSGRYQTMLTAGKIPGLAKIYDRFSDSGLFLTFKKIWNK